MKRMVITVLVAFLAGYLVGAGTTPAASAQLPTAAALVAPLQPLNVGQDQHSAFPGLAQMPNGDLHLVWRQGSDHYLARDGSLQRAVSTDGGVTYHDVLTLRSGADFRDPSASVIDGAAYLTMFTGTAAVSAQGAYVVREWGLYSRIDTLPYAAITAPVVELPDGRLGAAFYGRKAGEVVDTAWMGWSADQGRTWTTNRIMNTGASHAEPWLTVDGSTIHMFARSGPGAITMRSSPDSGVTWGPVRQVTTNCTGRPTALATAAGTLVLVCRLLPTLDAVVVYSRDHGATWQSGGVILPAPAGSPHGMTYAVMAETAPGTVYVVVGMEQSIESSRLYGGWLTEGSLT